MKKIYFVGDLLNNTGPAIVNQSYYPYLKNKVKFCFSNNKLVRSIHFFLFFPFSKSIVISGFSKLNLLYAKISKQFHKNTIYLMHGYMKMELLYSDKSEEYKKERIEEEYQLLSHVNKICCVSELFSKVLSKDYPQFKSKIFYVNNGITFTKNKKQVLKTEAKDKYTIISVGGGVRIKNNIKVCEAISKIKNKNIKYVVIGKLAEDGEKIKQYPFVEYYENLPHEEVLLKMSQANIYIQNSFFETFCLAIVEAIDCGCDVLISKNIGALSILENVKESDIIYENDSIDELSTKIHEKIKKSNFHVTYNKNTCSWKERSNELLKLIGE